LGDAPRRTPHGFGHDDWRQYHPDEKAGADRLEQLRRLVQQQWNAEPDQQLQHDGDNDNSTSTQTDRANSGEVSENPRLHLDDRSTASFASLTRSSKWRLTPLL
jgi:hypothetical protein